MSDIDWQKLQKLFHQAQKIPADELNEFLDQACGDDAELKAEVLKLVQAADNDSSDFTQQIADTSQQIIKEYHQGTHIGPYRIIKQLGQGGMGSVYLAERADDEFEQQVAIKLISRSQKNEVIAQRFIEERQILARLKHPNIALLLDGGTTASGEPYFAMEYLQGKDLISYCDEQQLSLKQRIGLFIDVCQAVSHAHGQLILHRDIKPANILVSATGQVKLLDFGIAKILKSDELDPTITAQDHMIMTPEYASPEQVLGDNMTVASDVYQLGLVLYQLLTGQTAVQLKNASVAEVKSKVVDEQPISPSQRSSQTDQQDAQSSENIATNRRTQPHNLTNKLKGDLDTIVLKCLHKEPAQRYHAVNELKDDLNAYLELKPIKARNLTVGYRLNRYLRRHWLVVSAAGFAVVALAAGLLFALISLEQTKQAELRASTEAETANQVSQFLIDMIIKADPSQSIGETVTVLQVLENSAAKIDQLNEQPKIQIKLLNVIGESYLGLDAYDKGTAVFQRSIDLAEALSEQDETLLIQPLHLLSIALSSRSENDMSFETSQQALAIARKHNAVKIDILIQNSKVLTNVDQHENALSILLEALSLLDDQNYHSSLEEEIVVLSTIGRYHIQHGNFDLAEKNLLKGMELFKNNNGELQSKKLSISRSLAELYKVTLRYEEAETLLQNTIDLTVEIYGEVHSETFLAYLSLGAVQVRMQKLDQAQITMDKALELGKKTVGKTDSNYASALRDYSDLKRFQGDYEGALAVIDESISINSINFGDDNAQTLASQSFQLVPMLFMGRYAGSLQLSKELVEKFSQIIPANHPFMFYLYESQAKAYFGMGDLDQAQQWSNELEKSIELKHQLSGIVILFKIHLLKGKLESAEQQLQKMEQHLTQEQSGNSSLLHSRYNNLLAQLQAAKGSHVTSLESIQKSLNLLITVRQTDHPMVLQHLMKKAKSLSQTGQLQEAINLAQSSFQLWLKKIEKSETSTMIMAMSYAEVLLSAGKYIQAIELLNEYSETLKVALGKNHHQVLYAQCLMGKIQVTKGQETEGSLLVEQALNGLISQLGEQSPLVNSCKADP